MRVAIDDFHGLLPVIPDELRSFIYIVSARQNLVKQLPLSF